MKSQTPNTGKAFIRVVDGLHAGKNIFFMFNPNQYTFTKTNNWTVGGSAASQDTPEPKFSGGQAASLTMELFFDTYKPSVGPESAEDVRNYTNQVYDLMFRDPTLVDVVTNNSRPPLVQFFWGTTWSFKAVITSITQKFTMSLRSGVPVRATLEVTFLQTEDVSSFSQETTLPSLNGIRSFITVPTDMNLDALSNLAFPGSAHDNGLLTRALLEMNQQINTNTVKANSVVRVASDSMLKKFSKKFNA